jgi:hypothetical protein
VKTIKLIRDRVPVDDSGRLVGHVHGDERIAYLFAKLHEETDEAREAWLAGGEGLESELADCWEGAIRAGRGHRGRVAQVPPRPAAEAP